MNSTVDKNDIKNSEDILDERFERILDEEL